MFHSAQILQSRFLSKRRVLPRKELLRSQELLQEEYGWGLSGLRKQQTKKIQEARQ